MEKKSVDISFGNVRFVSQKDNKEVIEGLSWNCIQRDGVFIKDSDVIDSIGVGLRTFSTIKAELKAHPFIEITRPKGGGASGATCYKFDIPMMMAHITPSRSLIGYGYGKAEISSNATDEMIASLGHSCMTSMASYMIDSFQVPNSKGIEHHYGAGKISKNIANIFASIASIKARTDKSAGNCGKEKVLLMYILATKTFQFSSDLLFIRLLADAWHNGILFGEQAVNNKNDGHLIYIDAQMIVDKSMADLEL